MFRLQTSAPMRHAAAAGRSPRLGFEGGQTPLRLRAPKRGFYNPCVSTSFLRCAVALQLASCRTKRIHCLALQTVSTLWSPVALPVPVLKDGVCCSSIVGSDASGPECLKFKKHRRDDG